MPRAGCAQKIKDHPNSHQLYEQKLISEGTITSDQVRTLQTNPLAFTLPCSRTVPVLPTASLRDLDQLKHSLQLCAPSRNLVQPRARLRMRSECLRQHP